MQIRGALLSIERDPTSKEELEELFDLLDTKGNGKLSASVIEEMITDLDVKNIDAQQVYNDAGTCL